MTTFDTGHAQTQTHKPKTGAWISVFSPSKFMSSKAAADKLIKNCKELGIDHLYVQVYRADTAYYNSTITDSSPFKKLAASFGEDPLKYMIAQAKKNDIKIYAWINTLCLSQNENSTVVKKIGQSALTKDKEGRSPYNKGIQDELDKYYQRENMIFLEPGNKKVVDYITSIAEEIMRKYPGLAGIQLDYIRYPYAIPFIPGSRFDNIGISYGYNYVNIDNFISVHGFNPKDMRSTYVQGQKWDDWRRAQVTAIVRSISKAVKKISPSAKISCAIYPGMERTYCFMFQDWTGWLKEGIADYVCVMSYTEDTKFMEISCQSMLLPQYKNKVYFGLGAHLMKDNPSGFRTEFLMIKNLSPGGIVFFPYDDIADTKALRDIVCKGVGSGV